MCCPLESRLSGRARCAQGPAWTVGGARGLERAGGESSLMARGGGTAGLRSSGRPAARTVTLTNGGLSFSRSKNPDLADGDCSAPVSSRTQAFFLFCFRSFGGK